jgi:hypothetical protein
MKIETQEQRIGRGEWRRNERTHGFPSFPKTTPLGKLLGRAPGGDEGEAGGVSGALFLLVSLEGSAMSISRESSSYIFPKPTNSKIRKRAGVVRTQVPVELQEAL